MLLGLPVLAPIFREEFDLTLTEVGIVLASVWVGPIFTLLPWGLAADRFGERLALAVGLTAMGLLVAAAAAVDEFYALVGLLGLASAAGSSVNSASGRAVMHWFGADERGFDVRSPRDPARISQAPWPAGLPNLLQQNGYAPLSCNKFVQGGSPRRESNP